MKQSFSALLSVYKNDNPLFFRQALDSVISQTSIPSEIVLMVDGPVSDELDSVIKEYQKRYSLLKVVRFEQNQGLGKALEEGVKHATYDIVARMDSDDIAAPDRFEKQLMCFLNDSELSIVGGTISEFIDSPDNIVGHRVCPLTNEEIRDYMKTRCAFNHMTVMFKKSEVLKVGNYQDWFWNEDYYLWIRMMLAGCKFANLPDTLVNVRVGKDMYARRGGWKYFKSEEGIQRYMLKHKLIGLPCYLYNVIIRFVLQVAMPNSLRGWVFRTFARK